MHVWVVVSEKNGYKKKPVWGIWDSEEKAKKHKNEIIDSFLEEVRYSDERIYFGIDIQKHEVK